MTGGEGLVEGLRDHAGDSLRVVAEYDRDGYEILYARDGLGDRIVDRADAVHRDLVLEGISRDHLEDLFGAGDHHCTMHRFDEMTAFHFAEAAYSGLFVSVDSDADVPLATFADTCWRGLQ